MKRVWILASVLVFGVSCAQKPTGTEAPVKTVRVVAVSRVEIPDEVAGFGSLSYLKKVDVAAPTASVIRGLPFREGARVKAGAAVVRLENPQIELAASRAENALAQAEAAVELARANLVDGEFSAEARVLGLAKSEAELAAARRELVEAERKQSDQEKLFGAGGITEEAIREGRFAMESKRDAIAIQERSLEIARIGLRNEDLVAAGLAPAGSTALQGKERIGALVKLSTRSLAAEVSAAIARREAARKELESARLAVAELTVPAPIDGIVGALYVEEGERVESEAKLLTLIESSSLYAVFPVREEEAPRLANGMKATVSVDATSAVVSGTVDLISPVADSQSASFQVRVKLRGSGTLKPGMFARAVITAGPPRKTLVIPATAVLDRRGTVADDAGSTDPAGMRKTNSGERARLFIVVDGTVRLREVVLGETTEMGREVLDGLSQGEVVVDRPETDLREGERVSVTE